MNGPTSTSADYKDTPVAKPKTEKTGPAASLRLAVRRILSLAHEPTVASELVTQCLTVGEVAPDFDLPSGHGGSVSLEALLAKGSVVIAFHHGQWCPYCIAELAALRQILPEIAAGGGKLVIISPEAEGPISGATALTSADGDLLTDVHARVANLYGVLLEVPTDVAALVQVQGITLPATSEDGAHGVPLPAIYVVNQAGIVTYAMIDPGHRRRRDPAV